jgi:hypothetical protein
MKGWVVLEVIHRDLRRKYENKCKGVALYQS